MMQRRGTRDGLRALLLVAVAGCGEGGEGSALPGCGGPDASPAPQSVRKVGAREEGVAIHEVQGAAHRSPFEGECVQAVAGVVTARSGHGFHFEAPRAAWDEDEATSEGLLVYTGHAPGVSVGDEVRVDGCVKEYVPGGPDTGNLPTTELIDVQVHLVARDRPLPPPVEIGAGGRRPPDRMAVDEASPELLARTRLDPAADALDFYESLEGMRVRVADPVAVGPATRLGRIVVVRGDGSHLARATGAGGLLQSVGDPHPERLFLATGGAEAAERLGWPDPSTGSRFGGAVEGVVGYRYGAFEVLPSGPLPALSGGASPEPPTALRTDDAHVTVATFNAENLAPTDPAHVREVAEVIVRSLGAPDIVALQEVQDGNGTRRGELSAEPTYAALREAIRASGGPAYRAVDVPPDAEDADGGQPGSNIRVAFLYRPGRVALAAPPARLEPAHPAWAESRKPLVARFERGESTLVLINLHLASKRGDAPLLGALQPPPSPSAVRRIALAEVVAGHVAGLLEREPDARLAVLGDLNDLPGAPSVRRLAEPGLTSLLSQLGRADRYTYVYRGLAAALDQVLVSRALLEGAQVDVVHVHADFPRDDRASDHDPVVARLRLP